MLIIYPMWGYSKTCKTLIVANVAARKNSHTSSLLSVAVVTVVVHVVAVCIIAVIILFIIIIITVDEVGRGCIGATWQLYKSFIGATWKLHGSYI